jgi:hypothetical protein
MGERIRGAAASARLQQREEELVVCRRREDYPAHHRPPVDKALEPCGRCGRTIVIVDPARVPSAARRICLQCAGLPVEPLPPREERRKFPRAVQ